MNFNIFRIQDPNIKKGTIRNPRQNIAIYYCIILLEKYRNNGVNEIFDWPQYVQADCWVTYQEAVGGKANQLKQQTPSSRPQGVLHNFWLLVKSGKL